MERRVSGIPLFREFVPQRSHSPRENTLQPAMEYLGCSVQQSPHLILEKRDPQNFHPTKQVVNQIHQCSRSSLLSHLQPESSRNRFFLAYFVSPLSPNRKEAFAKVWHCYFYAVHNWFF